MRCDALLVIMLGGVAACETPASQFDARQDSAVGPDARSWPDAYVEADAAQPDACVAADLCSVLPSYADLGYVAGSAGQEGSIFWGGRIAAPCGVEEVLAGIHLVLGRGVFSNGIVNGTYVLQGDELDIDTCATCVSLVVDTGTDQSPDCYFAIGGTLVLTSVDEQLTGHLEAASFVQVECSTWESPSSCATSIEYLSFDEPIVQII